VLPGRCPTGRTHTRIKGWMGRADQTTKVRGMFVHPSQVQEIVRRFPELGRVRLVVSGEMASDAMALHAECATPGEALQARVAEAIRELTKLRGDVQWCASGSLPDDGKLIDDLRSYR
jgi:phenylacetate-CoA ligase